MFGSTVLDVVIGLVFIYCLYSLLATTVQEIIASLLSLRARKLEVAIWRMLADTKPRSTDKLGLVKEFYHHPLIKYATDGGKWWNRSSYINTKDFSKVVVDILTEFGKASGKLTANSIAPKAALMAGDGKTFVQADTAKLLQSFLNEAGNDVEKFRTLLEGWFDDMMTQATLWYKRQAQWIIFVIGMAIAVAFNVSTFDVVDHLAKDKAAREQVVQLASSYLQNHTAGQLPFVSGRDSVTSARLDSLIAYANTLVKSDISESNELLGMGWGQASFTWKGLLGWIITALAISLGAPFWFDLLKRLMQLKGAETKGRKV